MVKAIITNKGSEILVDDDMYEELNRYTWCLNNSGYAWRTARKSEDYTPSHVLMHRYITGVVNCSDKIIDHKDGDKLNNTRGNLRFSCKSTNGMNRGLQTNNKSGFKGVWYDASRKKFQAYIHLNGRRKHLGRYESAVDAAHVYNLAAADMHGEFALLNEIPKGER